MILKIDRNDLAELTAKQLQNTFMYSGDINEYIDAALIRTENCFRHYKNKYYTNGNEVFFSPYHSGQYSIYLYYLSNTIWSLNGNAELCAVIYYLNKSLNAVDWYYEINLPDIFAVEHPLGSVMGRAHYSDHFLFYQGCSVGGTLKRGSIIYPKIGEYVTLCANSTVLGECNIGDNVVVGAGTLVKNQDVPNDSIVFGSSPNLIIKPRDKNSIEEWIENFWNKSI